jgi:hypothetical protein
MKAERTMIHYDTKGRARLLADIKANGYGYIKSPKLAKDLKMMDEKLNIKYRKEDNVYVASYYSL